MRGFLDDLRFALRMLGKDRWTALVAILTLALAIGANTAIFSVVNTVLLRPLPYPHADRLLMVLESQPQVERLPVPYLNYLDYKRANRTFDALGAMNIGTMTMTGRGDPEQLLVMGYSHDLLPILGVELALGRHFLPEEDAPGAEKVTLLSYGWWKGRFGGDPEIVGQKLMFDGEAYTVVGVLPQELRLYFGGSVLIPLGARADEPSYLDRAGRPQIHMFGRMKEGVTLAQARADLAAIGDGLAKQFPKEVGNSRPVALEMQRELTQTERPTLVLLMVAVVFVLLIAAANVANLLLERAMRRQREMGIRAALGASRWRLIRQMLVESTLLAALGGALGLLLALWGVEALVALRGVNMLDLHGPIAVDRAALAYTTLVALGTGVLFGLVPALSASRQNLAQALKDTDQHASAGAKYLRARNLLVVGEVALALMLLVGTALALQGLLRTQAVDIGYAAKGLLHAGISTTPNGPNTTPKEALQFWKQVARNVAAIPGVESVGWTPSMPMGSNTMDQFQPLGEERTPDNMRTAVSYLVSPGYIETMRIAVLAGRTFGPEDGPGAPLGIIVDKGLADAFFPGQDPIGQRLWAKTSGLDSVEIIGVVGHVKHSGLDEPEPTPYQIYYAIEQLPEDSLKQAPMIFVSVVMRVEGDMEGVAAQVRPAVSAADPAQPAWAVMPVDAMIAGTLARRKYMLVLLAVFAGLALVLAATGLYAVMANTVVQRTRELGVRLALGAQPRAIVRLVVRQGMKLVAIGLVFGVAGALWLTQALPELLGSQVSATDWPTYVAMALGLLAVGLLATFVPARRASRIDPMIALRHE